MADSRPGGIGAALAVATREARESLLREHHGGAAPVSYLELFFDLVYVFAITQLSHFLLGHLTLGGVIEAGILFLALWWAWMFTTWATNWADPQRVPVRIMLILVMLASLFMAVALPHAFAETGIIFAASYIAIQIGRTLFMAVIMRRTDPVNSHSMVRIAAWFAASGSAWLCGALSDDHTLRLALWLGALGFEYLGPLAGFFVPGLGRADVSQWNISGAHMAERCSLFIIIALGEGIVVTGGAFAAGAASGARIAALAIAFAGSVLMWWIYFDLGAERGAKHIEQHDDPGRVARNAYTYLHMPIVLGIVVVAVADALLLSAPLSPTGPALIATLCGGALAFVIGTALFKRYSSKRGNVPFSHTLGAIGFVLLAAWGWLAPPSTMVFGAVAASLLGFIALWEWVSFHGGWEFWTPRLGKRLGWPERPAD